jgi:hypothetical protein
VTPEQENELGDALTTKRKPSAAADCVELALHEYKFTRGLDGQVYGVAKSGPPLAMPLSRGLKSALAAAFYDGTGQVVSGQALGDALRVLEAKAAGSEPCGVFQRVAPVAGGIVLDLGRSDHQVVEVTPSGWTVRPLRPEDPLFSRTPETDAMPIPSRGDGVEGLWDLLNVRKEDRAVLVGWMVASFLPGVEQPIVLFKGEQGTGKTTAAKMTLTLLDPGAGQMTSTPRTEKDFAVAAQGRTVLGVDNLSTITPAVSDMFCRAVTGDSIVSRTLYTDDGRSIIKYRVGLIITSIDPGSLRGDLVERMLPIQLEPLKGGTRNEEELWNTFRRKQAALLASLLDLTALVLGRMPEVAAPQGGWPRLAGFGKLLAALDRELGTSSLGDYGQLLADGELDVLSGNPLADALLRLVAQEGGLWSGSASELLSELTAGQEYTQEERRAWRTGQELSSSLSRLTKELRSIGLTIERRKSNGKRLLTLRLSQQS